MPNSDEMKQEALQAIKVARDVLARRPSARDSAIEERQFRDLSEALGEREREVLQAVGAAPGNQQVDPTHANELRNLAGSLDSLAASKALIGALLRLNALLSSIVNIVSGGGSGGGNPI
jgi:hypothetical protein